MKKQAEEWLKAADDDLKVIDKIIDDESLSNMVAFHSQQAIEKSLKSVLEEYESRVPRTHNLINLNDRVSQYIILDMDKVVLERINEIYTDTRYPSDIGLVPDGKPSVEMVSGFYEAARYVKARILEFLT